MSQQKMREENKDELNDNVKDEVSSDMSEETQIMDATDDIESEVDNSVAETTTIENLINHVEALVFSSDTPISAEKIVKQLEDIKPPIGEVRSCLETLQKHYESRGVHLVEVATGWRFQVALECAPTIVKTLEEKPTRLSRALLETLALIAYRQPITRGEIEAIRGVVVSSHMVRTLVEHEWIRVVGHKDVPGRPALFATTKTFLDDMGLSKLEELPPLSELKTLMPDEKEEPAKLLEEEAKDEEADLTPVAEVENIEDSDISTSVKFETDAEKAINEPETDEVEEPAEFEASVHTSIDIDTLEQEETALEQDLELLPEKKEKMSCNIKSALAALRESTESVNSNMTDDENIKTSDETAAVESFRNLDDFSEIILTNSSTVSNHITDEVVNKDDNADDEENNQECSA